MKRKTGSAFSPDQNLSLAHRNAIAGARPEDLSYHRKASRTAVSEDWVEVTDSKKLKSKVRQVYYLNNPFKGNDSVLAHAVWVDECRKFYQEQLGKLLHFPSFPDALAVQPAVEIWPDKRIAELKAKVKKAKLGIVIAKKLGKSGCWISAMLNGYAGYGPKAQAKWMPKIEAALKELLPSKNDQVAAEIASMPVKEVKENIETLIKKRGRPPRAYDPNKETGRKFIEITPAPGGVLHPGKVIISDKFPYGASGLISGMMVDIKDGRLQVTLEVDVREAVRLYAQQNQINTEQKALVR
jgi:hypothetical protein